MNDVEFEKLLSYRPTTDGIRRLCLRDFIFDYYCAMWGDKERANEFTKAYTDELYKQFVNRKI